MLSFLKSFSAPLKHFSQIDDHAVGHQSATRYTLALKFLYPPRPLLLTSYSNALRILFPERHRLTFVLVSATPSVAASDLAGRIEVQTGLRARSADDFNADTVRWFSSNSEDVGDIAAMLSLAISVGLGVTGVMLYMFTAENIKQYAVLKAMVATSRLLLTMVFVQVGICGLLGTAFGLGLCGLAGLLLADTVDYPFRMMWFTPPIAAAMGLLICAMAGALSARPLLKLSPGEVFAGC
jgi:putative ABC transport system permease protein